MILRVKVLGIVQVAFQGFTNNTARCKFWKCMRRNYFLYLFDFYDFIFFKQLILYTRNIDSSLNSIFLFEQWPVISGPIIGRRLGHAYLDDLMPFPPSKWPSLPIILNIFSTLSCESFCLVCYFLSFCRRLLSSWLLRRGRLCCRLGCLFYCWLFWLFDCWLSCTLRFYLLLWVFNCWAFLLWLCWTNSDGRFFLHISHCIRLRSRTIFSDILDCVVLFNRLKCRPVRRFLRGGNVNSGFQIFNFLFSSIDERFDYDSNGNHF